MGIYYAILNLDKKQALSPHAWDESIKANGIVCGQVGHALAMLLMGPWNGDRIKVANDCGDMDEPDSFFDDSYVDISDETARELLNWRCGDQHMAHVIAYWEQR